MTDLTEQSFEDAINDIKKYQQETGEKISCKPNKIICDSECQFAIEFHKQLERMKADESSWSIK
jgi:hypothetical protein